MTDNGDVVGLLPFRCVAEVPRSEWATRTVRDCMLPRERVPIVAEDDDLFDAAAEFSDSDLSRALVLDGDRFVGLLSWSDVRRALELRPRTASLGVADGTRTRDSRDHNPGLYQLSYGHRARCSVAGVLRSSTTRL